MQSQFNLTYQNVRGLRTKTHTLTSNIANVDSDIICITESWLNDTVNDAELCSNEFQVFRRDRNYSACGTMRGGGCLMFIRNNISAVRAQIFESNIDFIEDLWIKIDTHSSPLYICTIYITPTTDHIRYTEHFQGVVDAIDKMDVNARIIIVGDYNLSNIGWTNSPHGIEPVIAEQSIATDALVEMMMYAGFNQFNTIKNAHNGVLDLVLSNLDYHQFKVFRSDFPVMQEDGYHPTLSVDFNINAKFLKVKKVQKRNFKKANYDSINNELSSVDWRFTNQLSVQLAVDKFYDILNGIIARNVPISKHNNKHPQWYSLELINLLRRKERARVKWKKSRLDADYGSYSELRRLAKIETSSSYDNYIINLQNNIPNNIKLFWSFTKDKRKTNSYPPEFTLNNNKSSESVEICQMFSQHFKSTYSNNNSQQTFATHRTSHSNTNTHPTFASQRTSHSQNPHLNKLNTLHFSLGNVESLLTSVDVNKNGGPDGIPNSFLKNTASHLAIPLTNIFNKSIESGIFPKQFKNANVTPIFKKGDKTDITNYRPICILNAFSKIFEKLVHDRTLNFLNNIFDKNQHGFMKNKSTSTNTALFVNSVAKNLERNIETHAIYTDFAKAFDSVDFSILLRKLKSYGIDGNLINWFETYLTNRNLRVAFNGSFSTSFSPQSGVPQGSVLGPLLFNIFINDLGKHLKNSYLLFADDLKIYSKILSLNDIIELQRDLVRLSDWCKLNRLKLNIDKCKFISFTLKRNPHNAIYYIDSTPLEQVYVVKDLGILIDSKFKFNYHIDHIFRKSLKMLGFIFRVTSKFTNSNCLKLLYNSLVRSHLEFQTPTWTPYQSTYKHKLERVQRKFTRHLYYKLYIPYTDYNSRLIELRMLSLADRRKFYDIRFLHSILHNNSLTQLFAQLNFRQYTRNIRNRRLFRLSPTRTYYGRMTDPVARLARLFNNEFESIDILHISYDRLKITLLDYLTLNRISTAN